MRVGEALSLGCTIPIIDDLASVLAAHRRNSLGHSANPIPLITVRLGFTAAD
jgi:hypothetical protein